MNDNEATETLAGGGMRASDQILEHLDVRVADLTTEQLAHVLACRRARETAEQPPPLEWETREPTPEDRAWRFAQWARSVGIDDEVAIGSDLYGKLLALGYLEPDAVEVLRAVGIVWRPRTADERLIAVATEMLAGGWDEATVRRAMAELVTDGG